MTSSCCAKISGAAFARLQDFDLAYDVLIYPRQLPAAIRLVEEFPDQRVRAGPHREAAHRGRNHGAVGDGPAPARKSS